MHLHITKRKYVDERWVRIPPASGQTSRKIQRDTPHFLSKLNWPYLLHRYSRNTWPQNKYIPLFQRNPSWWIFKTAYLTQIGNSGSVACGRRCRKVENVNFGDETVCHHQAEVPRLSPPTQNNIPLESLLKRPRLWGLAEDLGSKRDLDEVVILCLPARLAKGQCGWGACCTSLHFVVLTMRQSGGGTLPPADGIGGSRHVDLMNTTLWGQGHRDRCSHFFCATKKDNRNQFLWPACWTEAS